MAVWKWISTGVLACLLTLSVLFTPPDGHWIGDAERGREIYLNQGRCVECHRYQGEGSYVRGPVLDAHWQAGPALKIRLSQRPRPANQASFVYEEVVAGDAYLLESLLEPDAFLVEGFDPAMPSAHGSLLRLEEQDLADLLAYLNPAPSGVEPARPIPPLAKPPVNPWDKLPRGDARRGEELFFRPDDAACSGCHIVRVPRLEDRYHAPFWKAGSLVGPELTRLATFASPENILDSILQPQRRRTGGFWDSMVETHGERLFIGLLLADGESGVLLMDASPAGPEFIWTGRENIYELTAVEDSRMTHVFAELLDVQGRLDILAFLREAALESVRLGPDALPGQPLGARDPCINLYSGEWPVSAHPELLQRIPGLSVDSSYVSRDREP